MDPTRDVRKRSAMRYGTWRVVAVSAGTPSYALEIWSESVRCGGSGGDDVRRRVVVVGGLMIALLSGS